MLTQQTQPSEASQTPDTEATGGRPKRRSASDRARETRRLLIRYRRHGDLDARRELIARHLPLARQLARRYFYGREPLDDLVQVASVGLVQAVDRFDLARTTSFSSYAVPMMLGELRRHFRDHGWALHVPRGLQEQALRVQRAIDGHMASHGRPPTPRQLADQLDLSVEAVLEAMEASSAADATSLDAARRVDDDDGETRLDALGVEDGGYELVEYRSAIAGTLAALPDRDRQVLALRFVHDLTQTEIAEQLDVSQMQVSRLLRRAMKRLETVAAASERFALDC